MEFGAATHFAQGWSISLVETAVSLGVDTVRDSVAWGHVESQERGVYDFSDARTNYLPAVAAAGLDISLTFHPQNPLYNSGKTIYDPAHIEAFANFVIATLIEFDGQVTRIEIGNEFNGNSFVSGTVRDSGPTARAEYYTAILKAVANAVRPLFPEVEIAGGAMHSIPVGYAQALADAGAFQFMDVVVIHPYTLPAEQLPAALSLLDSVTGGLPIHVTEFGQEFESLDDAPDYLAKMVAMMAASGVEAAHWYALYEQRWFDNMELVDKARALTPAGESYQFVSEALLDAGAAVQLDAGPGTYVVAFGPNALIAWGEPQTLSINGPATVYDTRGNKLDDFDGTLSPDAPVIILSETPLVLGETVVLSDNPLLAHSFHDFDVDDRDGFEGPWSYFQVRGDEAWQAPLITMPGGEWANERWNPYLGGLGRRPLFVTADAVNPVDFNQNDPNPRHEYAILERFTASADTVVTINASWDVRDSSVDGVTVEISHNDVLLFADQVFDPATGHQLETTLSGIVLSTGDTLDFKVASGANTLGGDVTERIYEIVAEGSLNIAPERNAVPIAPDARTVTGTDSDDLIDGSGHGRGLRMDGGNGSDRLIGGAYRDVLIGGAGADELIGGAGNDVLFIDAADTLIIGGEGHDRVRVTGEAGVSLNLKEASVEIADGGSGDDDFDGTGATASLRLNGGGGQDQLVGGTKRDVLKGGAGADTLIGGAGNDVLVIDAADTLIIGGAGHDKVVVTGQAGVSLALHGASVEIAEGGDGDDDFDGAGAATALRLMGGDGEDTLAGGSAGDWLIGGDGADTFLLSGNTLRDRIIDFGPDDTLLIAGSLAPDLSAVDAAAREIERGLLIEFDEASILILNAGRAILNDSVFIA